jgi:hypothetical protein
MMSSSDDTYGRELSKEDINSIEAYYLSIPLV